MSRRLNYSKKVARFAYRAIERDAPINILEGSVRSGKTWALHPKILRGCRYPISGWKLITGVSKQSIYNNVLSDLFSLVGPRNYSYNHQSGLLKLCDSQWIVMGAKDEGSEKYIRGLTVGFCVGDEISLMPQTFFQMLLTRMSPTGSRFYGTTNPDNPFHWLKTDYLDNQELRRDGILWSDHYTMADNPNLSAAYVAAQQKLYKGLFHKRFIKGLWVMAEGAIYGDAWGEDSSDLFYEDGEQPRTLYGAGGHIDHIIFCDYGTHNPHVYLEAIDDGKILWVDREYYWDSVKEMRQKTDAQYVEDAKEFVKDSRIRDAHPRFVVDPSAASFKTALQDAGFWVVDANNEVTTGIQLVTSVFSQRLVRINKRCTNFIREHEAYSWDPKKAKRGLEEPVKINDHTCDAFKYGCVEVFKPWRLMAA